MKSLVQGGFLYMAMPPLYKMKQGKKKDMLIQTKKEITFYKEWSLKIRQKLTFKDIKV